MSSPTPDSLSGTLLFNVTAEATRLEREHLIQTLGATALQEAEEYLQISIKSLSMLTDTEHEQLAALDNKGTTEHTPTEEELLKYDPEYRLNYESAEFTKKLNRLIGPVKGYTLALISPGCLTLELRGVRMAESTLLHAATEGDGVHVKKKLSYFDTDRGKFINEELSTTAEELAIIRETIDKLHQATLELSK